MSSWFPLDAAFGFDVALVSDQSEEGSGLVMSGWDYLRTEIPDGTSITSMPYFPPLRFPGQYYDEETSIDRATFPHLLAWTRRIAQLPGWKHPYELMPRGSPDR